MNQEKEKRPRKVVSLSEPFASGLMEITRVLEYGPGKLLQAWLFTDGENDADLQLYDSPDLRIISNNDLLLRVRCRGMNLENSDSLKEELPFKTGLTAVLTGGGATYAILYRILKEGQGKEGEREELAEPQ